MDRHKDHFQIYKERCTKLNIHLNNRAILPSEAAILYVSSGSHGANVVLMAFSSRQTTLDGSIDRQPRPPTFTTQGMLDHVVELVISQDEAFELVDRSPFCHLLMYLRPSLSEKDIPHHTKLRKEIGEHAQQAEVMVKAALQVRYTSITIISNPESNPRISRAKCHSRLTLGLLIVVIPIYL